MMDPPGHRGVDGETGLQPVRRVELAVLDLAAAL